MPSQASMTFADQATVTNSNPRRSPSAGARSLAATKAVATAQRHRQERRAESLAQIQAQIADGTLVVRQMTTDERSAASGGVRRIRLLAPDRKRSEGVPVSAR